MIANLRSPRRAWRMASIFTSDGTAGTADVGSVRTTNRVVGTQGVLGTVLYLLRQELKIAAGGGTAHRVTTDIEGNTGGFVVRAIESLITLTGGATGGGSKYAVFAGATIDPADVNARQGAVNAIRATVTHAEGETQNNYVLELEQIAGANAKVGVAGDGQRAALFVKNGPALGTVDPPQRDFAVYIQDKRNSQFTGPLHLNNSSSHLARSNDPTKTPLRITLADGQTAKALEVNADSGDTGLHFNEGPTLFAVDAEGRIQIGEGGVPATATSTGTKGQVRFDATHVYFCIADNTWRRAPIAAW